MGHPSPEEEAARLSALRGLDVLDTPAEAAFDHLVALTAQVLHAPTALISLVDESRVFLFARRGFDSTEAPRDGSFCSTAIRESEFFEVPDATQDPRFADSPLVCGPSAYRFYAGALLRTGDGQPVGTLCVLDTNPRQLSAGDRQNLVALARVVAVQLELRRDARRFTRSEAQLVATKHAFDQHSAVAITDVAGRIRYANDHFCNLSGYDRESLLGQSMRIVNSGHQPPEFFAHLWATISAGRVWHGELRNRRRDGRHYWISATIVPMLDEDDRPSQYVTIQTDITDRITVASALRESELHYRTVVNSVRDVICRLDRAGNFTFLSSAWSEVTGFSIEESLGRSFFDYVHTEDREQALEQYGRFLDGEVEDSRTQFRCVARTGDVRWLEVTSRAIYTDQGTPLGTVAILHDVTDRVRIEHVRAGERLVLEQLAQDEPLEKVLETLIEGIESEFPEMTCSAFQYDAESNTLCRSVAPSLPDVYNRAIAAVPVAPSVGSCGSAAYLKEMVIVSDIASHPYWAPFKHLALPHGLAACWSQPILGPKGELYGTFAIYYRTQRTPKPSEIELIQGAARLAGLAIERRRADEELAHTRDQALESARLKSEFLANMSHEIRTPMNGVLGMLGLLIDSDLDAQERDYAVTAKNSAEGLLTILNDILDFSKIEAGRLSLEILDFDLRQTVFEVGEILGTAIRSKGLEIRCTIDPELPAVVRGDPGRVRQILVNLLGNAVKFTSEGFVEVHVERTAALASGIHAIRIEVRDSGIGIPPEVRSRLFQSFSQADSTVTRRFGGTGLGLAISRQLVELMGGEIGVESKQGEGSVFWFTLRLPAGAETSPRVERPAPLPSTLSFSNVRVLVADDNAVNQKIAKLHLERAGVRVDVAANGIEAVDAHSRSPYDLIFMDCQMPEMDGFAATEEIRRREGSSQHTPIVALTASVQREERGRCESSGMDDFVAKPVRPADLLRALGRWISAEGDREVA